VERQLEIAQCDDREKVLYASGQLQGAALDWWETFRNGYPNAHQITWQAFRENFRSHHVPAGLMRLKRKEFLALKQGGMSVSEYRDKFTQLSRYAPHDVEEDQDKQELFMEGLNDGLQYQLLSHSFANYQQLVDKALVIESKRRDMEAKKRKFQNQQLGSNSRPRFSQGLNNQQRYQGQSNVANRTQFQQRTPQQQQGQYRAQTPRQNQMGHTPVKNNNPNTPNAANNNKCFVCVEPGHLSYNCPKKVAQGQNSNQKMGAHTPSKQGQQNYVQGKVNHVTSESAQEAPDVVIGTFPVNSHSASVLFDSGASHSFIFAHFVKKNTMLMQTLKKTMLVSSPGGEMRATLLCSRVKLNIRG
jgi:hypothetical protein